MSYFVSQSTATALPTKPQQEISETVPNQTVSLRYIISELQKGNRLNVVQAMEYTGEDDVLYKLDTRFENLETIEKRIAKVAPPPTDPEA